MAGIVSAVASLLTPDARPFTTFNFLVEIDVDGVSDMVCAAIFSDVDGLEMTMEPKTIKEGGRNTGPVHMAGQVAYGQLSLKRGMTANFDLWTWFEATSAPGGTGLRGSADITVYSGDGNEQVQFSLTGCLPVKLRAPALNAKDGLIAIEEMSLLYESLTLKAPGFNLSGALASLL
ncbi:MAG: phage tail protein [Acidobacteriia bacterium]|nr:phage tail protein [Terriglobia bacterium]